MGRREVGPWCQQPRVGGAAPGRRTGTGGAAFSECGSGGAGAVPDLRLRRRNPPIPGLRIGSGTGGRSFSSTFLWLSVSAGVHFTNSAESVYFSSHFWFVFNSRESKRWHI